MHSRWAMIVGLVVLVTISVQFTFAGEKKKMKADSKVMMETSEGAITIELWANKTPKVLKTSCAMWARSSTMPQYFTG